MNKSRMILDILIVVAIAYAIWYVRTNIGDVTTYNPADTVQAFINLR